jgi:hypothetical protein
MRSSLCGMKSVKQVGMHVQRRARRKRVGILLGGHLTQKCVKKVLTEGHYAI